MDSNFAMHVQSILILPTLRYYGHLRAKSLATNYKEIADSCYYGIAGTSLGSRTCRCSGIEPALTPERTAGRVDLPLSISTNQKVACSNRAGINYFFPEQIFKWRSRRCCLIWRTIVFWSVLSLKPERFTAKSVAKLVNGEDVFVI